MRNSLLVASFSLIGLLVAAAPQSVQSGPFIKGDYVEARTASVFAGPCHYNSELMTSGRDAVMAWNITDGSWNQTSLAGVRVMAVVSSDANLGDDNSARKSEIVIDQSASSAQAAAVVQALHAQCGSSLGTITAIRRAAIRFVDHNKTYAVAADGFATLSIQAMPNDECCKQPNLVWYSPLIPLTAPKVGYTMNASSSCGGTWDRQDENSAFYGSFTFSPSAVATATGL